MKEDYKNFLECLPKAELKKECELISQHVAIPTELVEPLAKFICYLRDTIYYSFLKLIRYVEKEGGVGVRLHIQSFLFSLYMEKESDYWEPRIKIGHDQTTLMQFQALVEDMNTKEDAAFLLEGINAVVQNIEHPVYLHFIDTILERLKKTNDSALYCFFVNEYGWLSVDIDIDAKIERRNKIRAVLHENFGLQSKMLNVMSIIVDNVSTVACTMYGKGQLNPDVVDCHIPWPDYVKVNESTIKAPGLNYKVGYDESETHIVFEASTNMQSVVFDQPLIMEALGTPREIYAAGMQVTELCTDIYDEIPSHMLKMVAKILLDSEFETIVNSFLNELLPGNTLDVKFIPFFGVEICSGKKYPIKHTLFTRG